LWQFRNDIYHQYNEGTIARYKLEALERDMDKLWARHIELLPILWDFQKQHFNRQQRIVGLRYESKKYWATLAKLYLDDAENNRHRSYSEIDETNGWRTGVG
jgi:Mlc titration factor MtfA (ptsG expression regulator)